MYSTLLPVYVVTNIIFDACNFSQLSCYCFHFFGLSVFVGCFFVVLFNITTFVWPTIYLAPLILSRRKSFVLLFNSVSFSLPLFPVMFIIIVIIADYL